MEKQLLRKDEVVFIEVPHYDELAVKHIWPQFEADDKISKYLPDHIQKDRGPSH